MSALAPLAPLKDNDIEKIYALYLKFVFVLC